MLGVDIGYSPVRKSGAVCRLFWDETRLDWRCLRFRYNADERRAALAKIAGDNRHLAAAFDGPFRAGLDEIGLYRSAERLLTLGVAKAIGKPGPCHTPSGRLLNRATNEAIADLLSIAKLSTSAFPGALHPSAIAEAFPNSFMGVMLPDGHGLARGRAGKSDRYYVELCETRGFTALMQALLPGRTNVTPLEAVTHHDDRAALVCAMTALCVAAGSYVAIGDAQGRIFLPPQRFWNATILATIEASARVDEADVFILAGA